MKNNKINLEEMSLGEIDLEEMNLNIKYMTYGSYPNSLRMHEGKIAKIEKRETLLFKIEFLIKIITEEGDRMNLRLNNKVDFEDFITNQINSEFYGEKNKLKRGDFCIFTDEDAEIEDRLKKEALEKIKEIERNKERVFTLSGYDENMKIEITTMPQSPKVGDIIEIKVEEKYIKRGGDSSYLLYPPKLEIPYNDFFKEDRIEPTYGKWVFNIKNQYIFFIYIDDAIGNDGFTTITFMVCDDPCNGSAHDYERMRKCYKNGTHSKINSDYYLRSMYLDSPVYKGKNKSIEHYLK